MSKNSVRLLRTALSSMNEYNDDQGFYCTTRLDGEDLCIEIEEVYDDEAGEQMTRLHTFEFKLVAQTSKP